MVRSFINKGKRKKKLQSLYTFKTKRLPISTAVAINTEVINAISLSSHTDTVEDFKVGNNTEEIEDNNDADINDADYENSDDDGEEHKTQSDLITNQLKDAGLYEFLKVEKKDVAITTFLNRISTFILWANSKNGGVNSNINAFACIFNFITVQYQLITSFCAYLRERYNFEPSTVSNWVLDIKKLCEWFAVYREDRHLNFITNASKK
jgi:hypothetical protein